MGTASGSAFTTQSSIVLPRSKLLMIRRCTTPIAGCLQQCSFSQYCVHRAGAGGCLQQYGFSPYCTHRVGAGGCLLTAIRFLIILHASYERRRLLIAMQFLIILQTTCEHKRLFLVKQIPTIADIIAVIDSTVSVAMNVCEFRKDRAKQVQRKCFIVRFIINFGDFTGTRGRRI